jgi:hypothetical protein
MSFEAQKNKGNEKKVNALESVSMVHLENISEKIDAENEESGNVINPVDFIQEVHPDTAPYTASDISADNKKLEDVMEKFDNGKDENGSVVAHLEKTRLLAQSFESSLPILVERFNLFGEKAESMLTTKFDDVMNGVDVLVDFPGNQDDTLGLAVDLTISERSIENKLKKIKDRMGKGSLANIKYYKSKDGRYIGRKNHIVPLVISATPETALRIVENIYFQRDDEISEDVFNTQALEEIILQLEVFLAFCLEIEKDFGPGAKNKISGFIQSDLKKVEFIWDQKMAGKEELEVERIRLKYDSNFIELKRQLELVFK